jgi:hypothetical protein
MIEKRTRKLHWFHNKPVSITAAKMIAVSVLVLNVFQLKAM